MIKEIVDRLLPKEKKVRMILLAVVDALVIALSSLLGNLARFDFQLSTVPEMYRNYAAKYLAIYIAATLIIFFLFRLYSTMWTLAGLSEAVNIFLACFAATLVQVMGTTLLGYRMHRTYYVVCFAVLFFLTMVTRFSYRTMTMLIKKHRRSEKQRVIIVGAGEAGAAIAKEIQSSTYLNEKVVCFIDDNTNKKGKYLNGIRIEGGRDSIADAVKKHDADIIYVAIPSASSMDRSEILRICHMTSAKVRALPGMYQYISGDISVSEMREVQIEDLLGREPVRTNMDEITRYIAGKTVLVTGGGGSIGSELCRQIVAHDPKKLIVVDIYENNIYDLQQELKGKYGDDKIEYLIGSVRNKHRIDSIFEQYRPEIVFHAAAHKHVPLMETSPNEAIKNNVFGTLHVAQAADKYKANRFVLISTDKAVNPTNVMGASKRMCEMIIQMMSRHSHTNFVAVRFGNVLGSNGSVIPLFKKQIEEGGPVTVTHPEIIRYFMTIPEAVALVLQAGAYARGGEIFVLNMGKPVKILDLAKNLIRLSGLEPDVDIKIEFTGLRPGEKLYEEMLMEEEGLMETPNRMIYIGAPIEFSDNQFKGQLNELESISDMDSESIRWIIKKIVPTYIMPAQTVQKEEVEYERAAEQ